MAVDDIIVQFKKDIAADPGYWDLYALCPEDVVILIDEIERLRTREVSARVCETCGGIGEGQYRGMEEHRIVYKTEVCHVCKGKGVTYGA